MCSQRQIRDVMGFYNGDKILKDAVMYFGHQIPEIKDVYY